MLDKIIEQCYIVTMLIVIDMQPEFNASFEVLDNVCEYIRRAKRLNEKIVIVEYGPWYDEDYCASHDEILNLVNDYQNVYFVTKYHNGGADEIIHEVKTFPKVVKVCGVNTEACVQETVEVLAQEVDSDFTLLLDACNDEYSGQGEDTVNWAKRYRNISTTGQA